ncbi:hypothetical protein SAMN04490356_8409 [Streptomyces melanosporofaciens]|uniref:Uncharacterized protein n=1 Tax=Streptomyces melanosporofaciens TaxID=67327 RepID=A0A1H5AMF4_STRMJ|nr:hypothetical protein SAMN04490356_8409 [Streptomyces melanosporofaciens]
MVPTLAVIVPGPGGMGPAPAHPLELFDPRRLIAAPA